MRQGEVHALMGPNGSGKSTLSYALAGHPNYEVTEGSATIDGEDLLAMKADERAKAGLFLEPESEEINTQAGSEVVELFL